MQTALIHTCFNNSVTIRQSLIIFPWLCLCVMVWTGAPVARMMKQTCNNLNRKQETNDNHNSRLTKRESCDMREVRKQLSHTHTHTHTLCLSLYVISYCAQYDNFPTQKHKKNMCLWQHFCNNYSICWFLHISWQFQSEMSSEWC